MLPLITGSADSENSHTSEEVEVPEAVPVAAAVGVGVGDRASTDVAVDVAPGVPRAGLHPASTASATVQNHLSPFDSSISVRS